VLYAWICEERQQVQRSVGIATVVSLNVAREAAQTHSTGALLSQAGYRISQIVFCSFQ
jgi:hypothetical protein